MEQVDVVLANCDDWAALYIDGSMLQKHSISAQGALEHLEEKAISSFESMWFTNI